MLHAQILREGYTAYIEFFEIFMYKHKQVSQEKKDKVLHVNHKERRQIFEIAPA